MSDSKIEKPDSGYVVILNTLAKKYSDTRQDLDEYCDDIAEKSKNKDNDFYNEFSSHLQSYLTFGDFDRLSFGGINRFSKYYDLDYKSKYWLGKHQNVYLYRIEVPEVNTVLYPYTKYDKVKKEPDHGFCIKKTNSGISFYYSALTGQVIGDAIEEGRLFPFFLLSQISFSNEVITRIKDYSTFLKTIKKLLSDKIDSCIQISDYHLYYEIYGCMNSSDIAIIWLCEQYVDVLKTLDYLKDFRIDNTAADNNNLFFSSYSIIGKTISNTPHIDAELKKKFMENCKGVARISITVGDKYSALVLSKELKERFKTIEHLTVLPSSIGGEYDLTFNAPVRSIYFHFSDFNSKSQDNGILKIQGIREKILGIKTDFMAPIKEMGYGMEEKIIDISDCLLDKQERRAEQFRSLTKELKKENTKEEEILIEDESLFETFSLRKLYLQIRLRLKDEFNSHTGSVDTLDMLYTDYLSNIHDTYNAIWRNDYHYQFKKCLLYILKLFTLKVEKRQEVFWNKYTETIDNIRQQTVHFSQSGKLVMQIPASHLRYTASVDMLFHSYYGSAKAILESAYKKQINVMPFQSELLPIITTNSAPRITSRLYKAGKKCNDLRILQIDIPYSLLFDPITGLPHMVHELFHYIAPSDREERNRAILNIAVNESLATAYCKQIEEGLKQYIYDIYLMDPEKFNELGFEVKHYYDSPNCKEFIEDYQDYMKGRDGIDTSRIIMLRNSLSHVMWKSEKIAEIRRDIVSQIISDSAHPLKETTWYNALKDFRRTINSVSINKLLLISEHLTSWMNTIERMLSEYNEDSELFYSELIVNKTYIGCSDNIEDNVLNELIYKHKYNLLNPYKMRPIRENRAVFDAVEDIFLKGVREALPDLAMVKYCEMSDVEYLVTYARFSQDNGYSKIARFDKIRLPLVLSWIYGKKIWDEQGTLDFGIRSKGLEFVQGYVSEYMPHELREDEIVQIIYDAINWYRRLCQLVNAFSRGYDIYFEEIERLFTTYSCYFDGDYIPAVNELVEIVKKRRDQKLQYRKVLIKEEQWKKVSEIINDPKTPLRLEDIRKKLSDQYVVKEFYVHQAETDDVVTFETILNFVHKSSAQLTLEELGRIVNTIQPKGTVPVEEETKSTEQNERGNAGKRNKSIIDLINECTVYRAWGINDFSSKITLFCNYLRNGREPNTWFTMNKSSRKILPNALVSDAKEFNGHVIYNEIQEDLQNFYRKEEGNLKDLKSHEAIARMTIMYPQYKTNLIPWRGNFLSAIDVFRHNEESIKRYEEIELLLYSPGNYLKARDGYLKKKEISDKEKYLSYGNSIAEHIFAKFSSDEKHDKYIEGQSTNALAVNMVENSNIKMFNISESNIHEYFPVPFNFVDMGKEGRFLAYNLVTPCLCNEKDQDTIKLDSLQLMMLAEMINLDDSDPEIIKTIQQHAFLYRIRISPEMLEEVATLLNKEEI